MPHEKSCGAVLFRRVPEPVYLLLHYPGSHWDFPKGHVEPGEDEEQTTRREMHEETGIAMLVPVAGFRERIEYFYKHDGKTYHKEVVFCLMETDEESVALSHEHQGYAWLPYEEALERLTFDNAKEILKKAHRALEKS